MRSELRGLLEKQGYGFAGEHGGVKLCHWSKEDLKQEGRCCYKGTFYGVESHQCMQMTPVVDYCNFRCLYCWRSQDFDTSATGRTWDDPEELFQDAVTEQQRLLSGYKGHDLTDMEKWVQSQRPTHVAISLNGEPTVYPYLAEFIQLCHAHDMTTMVVTNGSFPKALETLAAKDALPTQLYISCDAPNKEIFNKLCVPVTGGAWEKLEQSLDIMAGLDCRTVARITCVKGWNMGHYDEYAALIQRADPDFIETKGYVYVGYSRERMREENMPTHDEVRQQADGIAALTDYTVESERADSRVCLLVKPGVERALEHKSWDEVDPIAFRASAGVEGSAASGREDDVPLAMASNGSCGCQH